ncbi:MAG: SAM-dependent chlorinase/fluorinase [Chitinophagaceae bacterium]|nr:SAM-dependent chlorinase/fluorinase [Bacteroidota bacterium]MCC6257211.1 SAM-dependent chlorinase/fluorinase [Chitinophagaceae bacterium]MCW5915856.1 SAM-dependent chlorinase/fluorinase [Ferruginibacter sp.]
MAIITITTDIGDQDFLAGAIKGTILQANPDFRMVEITHYISRFNYPQAAYIIRNSIRHFPKGTFHLVLVNLFDERPGHLLLANYNGQVIGCADNGLLPMILDGNNPEAVALPLPDSLPKNVLTITNFIANSFNEIIKGEKTDSLGKRVVPKSKGTFQVFEKNDNLDGQVIFIDNFENVVVNITREEFEAKRKGRKFNIILKGKEVIDKICETYADVPEGEKLALFNSGGYLEIAINKGNAAGLLGLEIFTEKQIQHLEQTTRQKNLLYQTVQIHFTD